ncbi:restriction endonuclease subunit S [Micromonospora sp. NBC_00389]|uniref:restriction endonuclease subunit S n=1 Tax=Micromonospora sp. NBC_00389 TaxID=2903586 RepID=UPI002E1EA151
MSDLRFPGNESGVSTAANYVSRAQARQLAARIIPPGSVVFPKVGAALLGNARAQTLHECLIDNNMMAVVPHAGDPRYWLYLLSTIDLGELSLGGPLPYVSEAQVRDIRVSVPPLDEQRRIADFLDAATARLDTLAALHKRTRHAIAGRARAYVDDVAARVTSTVRFKYVVRYREGPGIMAADFRESGVPLVRVAGLKGRSASLAGCNYLDESKVLTSWRKFRIRMGDYLLSASASTGQVSVVDDPDLVGAVPYTGIIILRPARPDVDMGFVEAMLASSMFLSQIDQLKAGMAIQHFGPTHLSSVDLPWLDRAERTKIGHNYQRLLNEASSLCGRLDRALNLLEERRQALIMAAVTGQIEVATARGVDV